MPLDYGSGLRMEYGSVVGRPFSPQYSAASVSQICQQISMSKPIGSKVMSIVVMPTAAPGWALNNKNPDWGPDNVWIVIGLLLPAVQNVRDGSSGDRAQLSALLATGGRLGVNSGPLFVYEAITWL